MTDDQRTVALILAIMMTGERISCAIERSPGMAAGVDYRFQELTRYIMQTASEFND